jgi:hypothetical protein
VVLTVAVVEFALILVPLIGWLILVLLTPAFVIFTYCSHRPPLRERPGAGIDLLAFSGSPDRLPRMLNIYIWVFPIICGEIHYE